MGASGALLFPLLKQKNPANKFQKLPENGLKLSPAAAKQNSPTWAKLAAEPQGVVHRGPIKVEILPFQNRFPNGAPGQWDPILTSREPEHDQNPKTFNPFHPLLFVSH